MSGSIPARAGEPNARRDAAPPALGLSPRVRGNHVPGRLWRVNIGSIPARAGEPITWSRRFFRQWVYPRACGGTAAGTSGGQGAGGLSPRVRGNRLNVRLWGIDSRSIPARAGEPPIWPTYRTSGKVYPRACGGTIAREPLFPDTEGLSPRVRGNRLRLTTAQYDHRSIPARAGEPV